LLKAASTIIKECPKSADVHIIWFLKASEDFMKKPTENREPQPLLETCFYGQRRLLEAHL
jgi:hypothetical protein